MPFVVDGEARFASTNVPGEMPSPPDNGELKVQQADGLLITRKADGTTRLTDLRPVEEQLVKGALAEAFKGVLRRDENLSDLTNKEAARSALGLHAPSFRRRVINGDFRINQRGAVFGTPTPYAAGVYTVDRWKAGVDGVTLRLDADGAGVVYPTIAAGTLVQVIEGGLYLREGGTYVLSWTGSAQARIYQGEPGGVYTSSPIVITGLAAGSNTVVEFGTGTLGMVQLEPGTIPTAFEQRDDELRRCQRYFQNIVITRQFYAAQQGEPGRDQIPFNFPPMRAAPTITRGDPIYSTSNFVDDFPRVASSSFDYLITPSSTGLIAVSYLAKLSAEI